MTQRHTPEPQHQTPPAAQPQQDPIYRIVLIFLVPLLLVLGMHLLGVGDQVDALVASCVKEQPAAKAHALRTGLENQYQAP